MIKFSSIALEKRLLSGESRQAKGNKESRASAIQTCSNILLMVELTV